MNNLQLITKKNILFLIAIFFVIFLIMKYIMSKSIESFKNLAQDSKNVVFKTYKINNPQFKPEALYMCIKDPIISDGTPILNKKMTENCIFKLIPSEKKQVKILGKGLLKVNFFNNQPVIFFDLSNSYVEKKKIKNTDFLLEQINKSDFYRIKFSNKGTKFYLSENNSEIILVSDSREALVFEITKFPNESINKKIHTDYDIILPLELDSTEDIKKIANIIE